jgi:hypothetical protein
MNPLPVPNWKAKPTAQYRSPHMHVSNTHSSRMFTVSLERATPASRAMKPACMKKTRNAPSRTHNGVIGLTHAGSDHGEET